VKPGQIIFNTVGILVAGILLLALLSSLFIVIPGVPQDKRGFWHFLIALLAIVATLLAGGGIANFAKCRLAGWPTGAMIFAYCLSVWLIPFGIWGIVLLLAENKRRDATKPGEPPSLHP
jgi:hypothetical protein